MNERLNVFDDDSVRKIADTVDRLGQQVTNLRRQVVANGTHTSTAPLPTIVYAKEDIAANSYGRCWVAKAEGVTEVETTSEFSPRVYNPLSRIIRDGEKLHVFYCQLPLSGGRWVAIPVSQEIIRFRTTEAKTLAGNVRGQQVNVAGTAFGATIGLVDAIGLWGPTPSGNDGYAIRMPDRATVTISATEYDAYEILLIEGNARFIEFTSTEAMGATNSTEMIVTVNDYYGFPFNAIGPGSTIVTHDTQGRFTRALSGSVGKAVYDERSATWNIWECQQKARHIEFTTTEAMGATSSGQAQASTVNDYWGEPYTQNPGSTVTVYDRQSLFARALSGAKGRATLDEIDDKYIIDRCETEVTMYLATVNSALATTDATKAVTRTAGMGEGQVDLAASTTGYNDFDGEADSGGLVFIVWNKTDSEWTIITGACPA